MREIILTAKLGLWTNYAGIYLHIWRNKIYPKKSTLAKYIYQNAICRNRYIHRTKEGNTGGFLMHGRRRSCRRVVPVERERERES
jgi:hypothetical protein